MVALAGLWFNQKKGLAIGVVTAGGAIGQGVVPFVVRLMITAFGWRDAALCLGIGYFVILMPLLMFLKPPPVIAQSTEQVSQSDENLWGVPHKITVPWLGFAAIFCCVCMAAPLVHLVPLGTDLGFSPQTAAGLLLALMTAGVSAAYMQPMPRPRGRRAWPTGSARTRAPSLSSTACRRWWCPTT